MKKFVSFFFVIISLIFSTFSCKDNVTSGDAKSNCLEEKHQHLWDMCEIPYYVESNFPANSNSTIQNAFNVWAEHTRITFKETHSGPYKIKFVFREFTEHEYEKFRNQNRCGNFSIPYAAHPTGVIPPNPNSEIHFNSNVDWDIFNPSKGDLPSFEATAIHEIGHVLGLKHIDNEKAIMYCCSEGQTILHDDDITAIQSIINITCDCDPISYPNAVKWRKANGGNDHLYEVVFVGAQINWEDANEAAIARGGGWHLVTITSSQENNFVESLFRDDPSIFNCCQYPVPVGRIAGGPWLGAKATSNTSNDWTWVTGEPFNFTDWGPLEPFGNGNRINYCQFGASQLLAWNDMPSNYFMKPLAYILECSANGK
ncbi:MAG: matrixin family metalloprotease [bacterium]